MEYSPAGQGLDIQSNPIIHNVIGVAYLDVKLTLTDLSKRLKNATYAPRRFPAIYIRIPALRTTVMAFSTGKLVSTGSTSVQDAEKACKHVRNAIKKLNAQRLQHFS